MSRIKRDDIQRIGDAETLLHFLDEKLNLPISEGVTLEQIALPLPLPFLGLDAFIIQQIIDCQDFSGLPKEDLGDRRPFLIRFRREHDYSRILRAVARGLHQKNTNPSDLLFICANEEFQPFAFAYFNDSTSTDWDNALLTVLVWTQDNTLIHTGATHELPAGFFPSKPIVRPVPSVSPEALLAKLKNTGVPLSRYGNIYSGILTGHNDAFVIDEPKRQQLITNDVSSRELIEPLLLPDQKWKAKLMYLICIPSSRDKLWPWSEAKNEVEAKRIFRESYSAISAHLDRYEDKLRARSHQGKFYWEFTPSNLYSISKRSKIFYPSTGTSLRATYDTLGVFPLFPGRFILTDDLSLLAILNSALLNWYVQIYRTSGLISRSGFKNTFMGNVPIAGRTEEQKENLSQLVQQILTAPDSLSVPDFERKIDELVYQLYGLTDAEIAFINEHRQSSQNTEPQQTISTSNPIPDRKTTDRSVVPVSPQTLLTKLKNIGTPLGQHYKINTGITPGRVEAFVIDEAERRRMISVDSRNSELIVPLARVSKANKWKSELTYLIWISSSHYKRWPWSDTENKFEAERIFQNTYPVVSQHLISYKNLLKDRADRHQGKFYWELSMREPKHKNYSVFYQPKIIYPIHSTVMEASYDSSGSIILGSLYSIPTDDLSLIAILNSTLFGWYAQFECRGLHGRNSLQFTQRNMVNVPIVPRTADQKVKLSDLVQQVLDNLPSRGTRDLVQRIDQMVYKLYELTDAEIALIEKGIAS